MPRICTWMFSMITVDMSTRMPIDNASPPSDMMLIVFPVSHRPNSAPSRGQRNVGNDDDHAAQIVKEQQDHQAGQAGADQSFGGHAMNRRQHGGRFVELEVRPRRRLGTTSRNSFSDLRMSATTVNVDAVLFLMIGK